MKLSILLPGLLFVLVLLAACEVATEPLNEPLQVAVIPKVSANQPLPSIFESNGSAPSSSDSSSSNVSTLFDEVSSDPCSNMTCAVERECRNGVCACPVGKFSCIDGCADCCSSKDCGSLSTCINGTCAKPSCDWNQEFKDGIGDCGCVKGTRWCLDQKLCIPDGLCCSHAECPDDKEFCNPYRLQTTVCYTMKNPSCKKVLEYQKESLEGIILKLREIRQGGLMVFDVGNATYRLKQNETVLLDNATLSAHEIVASGGNCREVRD